MSKEQRKKLRIATCLDDPIKTAAYRKIKRVGFWIWQVILLT